LDYVDEFRDRHGKARLYFRRAGFKRVALPGPKGSDAFLQKYAEVLAATNIMPVAIGSRAVPGSIDAAVAAFYQSHAFLKNKPITQRSTRNILEALRVKDGGKRIATLERRHIVTMLAEKQGKPAAQSNWLKGLRMLLAFAVETGMRSDNPAIGIKLETSKSDGWHSWTDAEIGQFEAAHSIGTRERLAFALLLYTAQRRSDVVALGPAKLCNGVLHLTQSKTGANVIIPMVVPLAEVIAATPTGVKTFLVTDKGKPFTSATFGNWFRGACRAAGLPHCSAHGLRKAFIRRMAEAGCSEDLIASVSGHKNMQEIRTYTQGANKARMAQMAMTQTLAAFPGTRR
jgi:integrase